MVNNINQLFNWYTRGGQEEGEDSLPSPPPASPVPPGCEIPPDSTKPGVGEPGANDVLQNYSQKDLTHEILKQQADKYSKDEYKTSAELRQEVANHLQSFMIASNAQSDPIPFQDLDTVEKIIRLNNSTFENSKFQKELKAKLEKPIFNKYRFLYYVYTECARRIMNRLVQNKEAGTILKDGNRFKQLFEQTITLAEFEKIIQKAKYHASVGDLLKEVFKKYFSAFNSDSISTASGLAKLVKAIMPQRYHYYTIKNENPDEIERFKDVIQAYERDMERDEGEFDTMVGNLVDVLQMSSLDENMFKSTVKRLNSLFNEFGYNISSKLQKGGFLKIKSKRVKQGGTDQVPAECKFTSKNILKKQTACGTRDDSNIRLFNYYTFMESVIDGLDKIINDVAKSPEGLNLKNKDNPTTKGGPTPNLQGNNGNDKTATDAEKKRKLQELQDYFLKEIDRVMNEATQLKKIPLQQGDVFSTVLYTTLDELMEELMKAINVAHREKSPFEKLFRQIYKDLEDVATELFTSISKEPPSRDAIDLIDNTLPDELQGLMDETLLNLPITSNPIANIAAAQAVLPSITSDLEKLINLFILYTTLNKQKLNTNNPQQTTQKVEEIIKNINNNIEKLKQGNLDHISLGNSLQELIKQITTQLNPTLSVQSGGADEKEGNNPMRLTEDVIREDASAIKELRKKLDVVRQNLKSVEREWKSYEDIVKIKSFSADIGVKVDKDLVKVLEGIKKELDKSNIHVADVDDNLISDVNSSDVNIENHNAFNTYFYKGEISGTISTKILDKYYITYNFTNSQGDNEYSQKRSNFKTNRNALSNNVYSLYKLLDKGDPLIREQLDSIYKVLYKFSDTPAIYYKSMSSYLTINSKIKTVSEIITDLNNPNNDDAFIKFNDNYPFLRLIWVKEAAEKAKEAAEKAKEAAEAEAEAKKAKEEFLKTIHVIVDIKKVKEIVEPIINNLSKEVGPVGTQGEGVYAKNDIISINEYLTNYGKTTMDTIEAKIKDSDAALSELIKNTIEYAKKYAVVNPMIKQKILGFLQGSNKTVGKLTLEQSLRDIKELTKNDFDRMKVKIGIEYKNLNIQKGGAVKENLLENRKTISDLIQDGYKQLDLVDALMQDFSGSLTKSVDMPGYYATNVIELGGFSVFDMLYKKYIMSANDSDKGPYVASFELGEGMKSNKLIPREVLALTKQDKLMFIGFTFFIRLGTLALIDYLVNRGKLKQLKYTLLVYVGIYIGIFLLFWVIINLDSYKLRIVFNYLNMHSNSSVVITHPALVGLFGTIMFLVMKNMDAGSAPAVSNEDKTRLKYRMQVITLIAWVFVSILTFFT